MEECKKTLRIKKEIMNAILNEARRSEIEICGLLFGIVVKEGFNVLSYALIRNIENSPISFKMDPREMFNEIIKHRNESMDVVGLFHSHMLSIVPSVKDLYYMKLWNVPWLIVDRNGNFLAYLIEDNEVCLVKVLIIE
ncbi:MAG: metalloprotease [Desulfurococcales archaeon ex4484_217_2]|nr:MAG: metalloprotease [Desulfurococcales archaeon ex4484_217_2]